MMLDAWDCIFLWVGQNARDDEKKEAERMAMVRCCILMDFPIPIDTLSMGLPIVYFKGSQVEFSKLLCISVPEGCFNYSKQCRP